MSSKDLGDVLLSLGNEAKELYLPQKVKLLEQPPSPLVFLREYVMPNIPVVIKNGVKHWPAIKKWTDEYLKNLLGNKNITVALTPNGYADAPQGDHFVMPYEIETTFTSFLQMLQSEDMSDIAYLQNQNSSFTEQFSELIPDASVDIPWASEAFGKVPDAVNFWMGSSSSVSSMHKDHYENMYAVVRGSKTFILHPPTDLPYLMYKQYIPARYEKVNGSYRIVEERNEDCCSICRLWQTNLSAESTDCLKSCINYRNLDNEVKDVKTEMHKVNNKIIKCTHNCHATPRVPWIATNPLNPDYETSFPYDNSHPLKVTLQSSDLLYLPSLWFHHVQQEDNTIAINFWYDMEYDIKYNYFKFVEKVNAIYQDH